MSKDTGAKTDAMRKLREEQFAARGRGPRIRVVPASEVTSASLRAEDYIEAIPVPPAPKKKRK